MLTLNEVIDSLSSTNSKLEKIKILEENKENEDLKKYFEYCLNHKKRYGVKNVDYEKTSQPIVGLSYNDVFEAADTFLQDKSNIKERMQNYRNMFNEKLWFLFSSILIKDPRCGVNEKIAKKIWPDLFPFKSKLCKAESYTEKLADKYIKFPCYVQTKADGSRCLCLVEKIGKEYDIRFLSSSGREYNKFDYQIKSLKNKLKTITLSEMFSEGFVLDGELLVYDEDKKTMDRKEGNGILNKSLKDTITKEEAKTIYMNMWDMIPLNVYNEEVASEIPYEDRLAELSKLSDNVLFIKIKTDIAYNKQDVRKFFAERLSMGLEGVVIKNMNFFWSPKRVHDQMKLKLVLDSTLKVVGFEYGVFTGKNSDKLGCLKCESEDGLLSVDVGVGYSEEERVEFVKNTPKYVEVRSNGIIYHAGKACLFLPRYIEVRNDKQEADSLEKIKKNQESTLTGVDILK